MNVRAAASGHVAAVPGFTRRVTGRDVALALAGLLVFGFVGYPILLGLGYFELGALRHLAKPDSIEAFTNSLLLTLLTVVPSAMIAVPLAWLCARSDLPGRKSLIFLTSISYVVPVLLTSIAYAFLLGRNSGLVNRLFIELTGSRLFDAYSFAGVVLVSVLHCYPLIFFTTYSGLTKMDPELEQAGRSCGLSPVGVFRRITLGAVLPSIMAGVAFASAEALTMLGAPLVLGLPVRLHFLTTELYAKIVLDPNLVEGIALSLPLVGVTIFLLWMQGKLTGSPSDSRFAVVSGKGARGDLVPLGRWTPLMLAFAWAPVVLSLVVPVCTLLTAALMNRWFRGFRVDNFTFSNFLFVLSDDTTILAVCNSLILALALGFGMALFGGLIAILIAGRQNAVTKAIRFLADLPLGLPHVVAGILVILAWYGPPLRLGGTLWILVFGYVLMMLPFAVKTCEAARGQIDNALIEAAQVVGCTPRQSWRYVLLPLMKNGMATSFVIVFLVVVKEFSLTAMVYSANTQTLAVRIYTFLEGGSYEKTAAAAILLLVITFVCLGAAARLFRVSATGLKL